jgi:hypothetical protein
MIRSVVWLRAKTEPNPVRYQTTVELNSPAEMDGPSSKSEILEDATSGIRI